MNFRNYRNQTGKKICTKYKQYHFLYFIKKEFS